MQGSREQQEAEHPVQHRFVEIDTAHHQLHFGCDIPAQRPQQVESEGEQQRDQHDPDGGGQTQETVVEIAEDGGDGNQ